MRAPSAVIPPITWRQGGFVTLGRVNNRLSSSLPSASIPSYLSCQTCYQKGSISYSPRVRSAAHHDSPPCNLMRLLNRDFFFFLLSESKVKNIGAAMNSVDILVGL